MKLQWKRFALYTICIFASASLNQKSGHAFQPKWLEHKNKPSCTSGPSNKITGMFEVKNVTGQVLKLQIEPIFAKDYNFEFSSDRPFIRPGDSASVRYEGGIFA